MLSRRSLRALTLVALTLAIVTGLLPVPVSFPPAAAAASIDPAVLEVLAASGDGQGSFIVVFEDRADLSRARTIEDWDARGQYVMERLQAVAERSQREVRAQLAARSLPGRVTRWQSFWIANVITVTGDREAAEALARAPGVLSIASEMKIDPPEPPATVQAAPEADLTWGIEKIGADQVWTSYGKKGEGMVIGVVDTGVQWDHSALKGSYRGWNGSVADHDYSWWDPAAFCAGGNPCDTHGHGTHTTGISAGGNSPAQGPIGVAPGAKWIHAAGCCASNASLLSSLQWMAAPTRRDGTAADPSKRPNVVNNSWGGPGGSKIFYDAIESLRAAGIVPVFSAGNNGSACGTLGSPGDNTNAFNVGSTAASDGISSFSSRGPNPFTGAPGPEVSAPGDNIYSSLNNGGYTIMSGTSMAAPHVAGAVALLMSVEPDLVGKVGQVEEFLRRTGVQLTAAQTCGGVPGSQIPNSTFGWGRIDVKAAVSLALNAGTLSGTVTGTGGSPVAGATVAITRVGKTLTQPTDASGNYSFTIGAGSYDINVKAFGYNNATAAAVSVTKDAVTDRDLALASASVGTITGSVLEGGDPSKPVAGALVQLLPALTGMTGTTVSNGTYTLNNVPFGAYTVRMTSPGYATLSSSVSVDGAETANFSPAAVPDYVVGDGGDTCSVEYNWIDATSGTVRDLADDANVNVTLPWSFSFYGNSYSSVYVSSNGFVSFAQGYNTWHGIVPFEGTPNNQIIGLGDDLNPEGGTQGKVYTKDLGDGRFVIQYDQVQHWKSGDPETFQIILYKNDGTILVQYKKVSWPDYANAGIENADGSRGILYSHANNPLLFEGLAVKYTPFAGKAPACVAATTPTVSIAKDATTAVLTWQHVLPNTKYEVWRSASPYFEPPGAGTQVGALPATQGAMSFTDPGTIGSPAGNHFWLVRGWLNGAASGPSNRVGEFDFSLAKGN
jgi:hypothetical protein